MNEKHLNDLELEAFFAAGREDAASPSPDLFARVLTDAETVLSEQVQAQPATPLKTGGFLSELFGGIGGWPSLAGLATATVAGLWIGISPPAALEDFASVYLTDDSESYLLELMPNSDDFLVEG